MQTVPSCGAEVRKAWAEGPHKAWQSPRAATKRGCAIAHDDDVREGTNHTGRSRGVAGDDDAEDPREGRHRGTNPRSTTPDEDRQGTTTADLVPTPKQPRTRQRHRGDEESGRRRTAATLPGRQRRDTTPQPQGGKEAREATLRPQPARSGDAPTAPAAGRLAEPLRCGTADTRPAGTRGGDHVAPKELRPLLATKQEAQEGRRRQLKPGPRLATRLDDGGYRAQPGPQTSAEAEGPTTTRHARKGTARKGAGIAMAGAEANMGDRGRRRLGGETPQEATTTRARAAGSDAEGRIRHEE